MDLFAPDPLMNLLPCDGVVNHFGQVLEVGEAERFLETLICGVPWQHDEVVMFGRRIFTARKVAWFGDAGFSYTYSGTTKQAVVWTPELQDLKQRVEKLTGAVFNSCLLNLYHDGSEGMGWHSDDEKSLVEDSAIASLSLGAARKFSFKHKRLELGVSAVLQSGSLLVMKGTTQKHWLHALPKSKRVTEPRINLTFRAMAG
jgi:alkylated DNA repair dioxygenase AlkB